MGLARTNRTLYRYLSDQDINRVVHSANKENWMVKMGPVHVNRRAYRHHASLPHHSPCPVPTYPCLVGPGCRYMLEQRYLHRRDLGTSWYVKQLICKNKIGWLVTAYSILSDFLFSLLPVVVLWNIRVPLRLKVGVFALMSVGFLSVGTGCISDINSDLTIELRDVLQWELHFRWIP